MANQTVTVLEADGVTSTDVEVLGFGRQAAAASKSTAMSTEDKAVLDASVAILGAAADAASATTTIKAALRAIATALGTTALDLGSGTGGSRTLRTTLDTASAGVLPTVTSDQASNYAAPALRTVPQEVHIGETGGKTAVVSVTLSTDTSAYASGDLIADTQQIDAFFRKVDGTGVINSINIIDEDAQGVALYIIFMSTTTSLGTENSAPNISDANLTAGFQGIVAVATTDYVTVSGTKVATIKNIGLPVKAVSGTDDIYIAVLNATGTPTFTAAGLEMRIGVLLD